VKVLKVFSVPLGKAVLHIKAYTCTERLRLKGAPFLKFVRLQVHKRVGISQVEVHERVEKSVINV